MIGDPRVIHSFDSGSLRAVFTDIVGAPDDQKETKRIRSFQRKRKQASFHVVQ